jgi:hypothetical protein
MPIMTNKMNLHEGPAGARDLILECQEILLGVRTQLTPLAEYHVQRLRAWQSDPSVAAEDTEAA